MSGPCSRPECGGEVHTDGWGNPVRCPHAPAKPDQDKLRSVLLICGHLDGQWVNVPRRERCFRAPKPMRLDIAAWLKADYEPNIPILEIVDYRIEPMPIRIRDAGGELWIGTPIDLYGRERDEAIVRAIFQRDVAQRILAAP